MVKKVSRTTETAPPQPSPELQPSISEQPRALVRRLPTHRDPAFLAEVPDEDRWERMLKFCNDLVRDCRDMLPDRIKTGPQAALTILKGREVGLPMVASLETVFIVKGRAGLLSKSLAGLLLKHGCKIEYPVHTTEKAVCRITRPDGTVYEQTFTMADASRMFTTEKDGDNRKSIRLSESFQYKANAEEMLQNRALSRGSNRHCPDMTGGLVIREEVEDEQTGTIDVTPTATGPDPLAATAKERLFGKEPPPATSPQPEKKPAQPERETDQSALGF